MMMSTIAAAASRLKRYGPFLFLAAAELIWCVYLTVSRRIPAGHDGFQYFYLKYYFFNDFVRNGELSQWMPYMTHGSPSAWWYAVQGGIFDSAVMLLSRLFRFRQFLPIFYFLLFLERLTLLAGTWLLASEHFRTRAAVFAVSAAVATTSIWYTQPWWNFHAFVALPMLLFLMRRSIVDFRWRWLVGLCLLFFLQTFGNLAYYLPMTALVVFFYACLTLTRRPARSALWARLRFSFAGLALCGLIGAALGVEMFWLRGASSDIQFIGSAREADGRVALVTFLTYAGYTDLRGWNQFFTSLTPHLDFTLFGGFLIAGLTVITIGSGKMTGAQKMFASLALGALLVATASPVATVVYYLWPMAKYFRHLALLSPVAKVFAILLAGATLDRLIYRPYPFFQWGRALLLTLTTWAWIGLLIYFAVKSGKLGIFFEAMGPGGLPAHTAYNVPHSRLYLDAAFILLAWLSILTLIFVGRFGLKTRNIVAWAAVVLLFADVSIYGFYEMRLRTVAMAREESALFRFTPLPYFAQRMESPDSEGNKRLPIFAPSLGPMVGERYWSQDLLWMVDAYRTAGRTVFWSTAVDSLFRERLGNDLSKYVEPGSPLHPPDSDRVLSRLGGFSEPKIRFAPAAILCPDVPQAGELIRNAAYDARTPVLISADRASLPGARECNEASLVGAGPMTANVSARIIRFTSNLAEFDVDNPTAAPVIMTYSDGWNDGWEARVNGERSPVFRSDLAYKAVVAPPGRSRIVFQYIDWKQRLVFGAQSAGIAAFLGLLVWIIRWKIVRPLDPGEPAGDSSRQGYPLEESSTLARGRTNSPA
ncbi:MAG TPA: hypothetical protein VFY29_03875 [Terriglobia bacterium]|nr:hypothetical protein [Terriglobia bacterium]